MLKINAAWDPQYQFGVERPACSTREEYESACGVVGIAPRSDDEIAADSYGLIYAEYGVTTWRETMTREKRVRWLLESRRVKALEEERRRVALAKRATMPKPTPQRTYRCRDCGQSGPDGQYPFSTNPSGGYCDDCEA